MELMISSFISVVILLGVIQLTLANQSSYVFQNQISQIQENVRYAMNEISQKTKNSRNYTLGCDVDTKVANLLWSDDAAQSPINNMGIGLSVIENNKKTKNEYNKLNKAYEGSDILYIADLIESSKFKSKAYDNSEHKWILDEFYNAPNESIMLAKDKYCEQVTLFVAKFNNNQDPTNSIKINEIELNALGQNINGIENCSYHLFGDFHCAENQIIGYKLIETNKYQIDLYPIQTVYYYVAPSTQKDSAGNYYPALFRNSDELVQGVEKLNILIGLDINNDEVADQFVKANALSEEQWLDVKNIKLEVTIRSLEKVSRSKGLDDDGYLRKTFTQTIHLRN